MDAPAGYPVHGAEEHVVLKMHAVAPDGAAANPDGRLSVRGARIVQCDVVGESRIAAIDTRRRQGVLHIAVAVVNAARIVACGVDSGVVPVRRIQWGCQS